MPDLARLLLHALGEDSSLKVYSVYHYGPDWGGDHYLMFSDHYPRVQEVVDYFGIDYEPEKDEWIDISGGYPIEKIDILGEDGWTKNEIDFGRRGK